MTRGKAVILMAAGRGTRMKSETTKVLHPIAGRPMIHYPVRTAIELGADRIVVVLGYQREDVERYLHAAFPGAPIQTVLQAEQLGTAHAVSCAEDALCDFHGDIFILSGDVPTLPTEIIRRLDDDGGKAIVSVLGMELDDPGAYGRLICDDDGQLKRIVEARDCQPDQLDVRQVNAGVYRVDAEHLFNTLKNLSTDNAQGEYYLTDIVEAASENDKLVSTTILTGNESILAEGVNDRIHLAAAEARMQGRLRHELMVNGVTLIAPDRVILEDGVVVGADTVIEPDVMLMGTTVVGRGCRIEQSVRLSDSEVGDGSHIKAFSYLERTRVAQDCQVGPFARLREGTHLGDNVKIGNFVETKKAVFGDGAKASHLSYIGDASVGAKANIGAGTITCNYDGYRKHRTEIGAGAFIGSDTQLVAPVVVGAGALVAAGTTVSQDVPADALAIARTEQKNVSGWAAKRRRREDGKD